MTDLRLDARYPALILKKERGLFHHGSLGIARSLGRLGVPVYAIVDGPFAPLTLSRYVTGRFIWKSAPPDSESFLQAMEKIADAIGRPTVLFPVDDHSAVLVAENAVSLADRFLIPQVHRDLPRQLSDKERLYALCERFGVGCPLTVVPKSESEVHEFVEKTGFPLVVKVAEQWAQRSGMRTTYIVKKPDQLRALLEGAKHTGGGRILLQEFVPGQDWIYHGYRNDEINLSVSFTGRKLLSYPAASGATACGVSVGNETLVWESEKLLKHVSYSGIVDMDWRCDSRDGRYKLLDCNPRVGMNFRMFSDSVGMDVVRAQYFDLTGRSASFTGMAEGRLFTVEPSYALLRLNGQGESGAGPMPFRSRELAWFAPDDLWPMAMMGVRLTQQMLSRGIRRVWKNVFRRDQ